MDVRETSINQEIHAVIDREVNLDSDDDGSLPDLNELGLDLSNNNNNTATRNDENNPEQVIN